MDVDTDEGFVLLGFFSVLCLLGPMSYVSNAPIEPIAPGKALGSLYVFNVESLSNCFAVLLIAPGRVLTVAISLAFDKSDIDGSDALTASAAGTLPSSLEALDDN